jgi:hypothetical protein
MKEENPSIDRVELFVGKVIGGVVREGTGDRNDREGMVVWCGFGRVGGRKNTLRFYDYDEKKTHYRIQCGTISWDFRSHVTRIYFAGHRPRAKFGRWSKASSLRMFWVILSGADAFKWGRDLTLDAEIMTCDLMVAAQTMALLLARSIPSTLSTLSTRSFGCAM